MKEVPPLPGEEALYALDRVACGTPLQRTPETKKALVESFAAADEELVKPLFQFQYNGTVPQPNASTAMIRELVQVTK